MNSIETILDYYTSLPNDIKNIHQQGWKSTIKNNPQKILNVAVKIFLILGAVSLTFNLIANPIMAAKAISMGAKKSWNQIF